MQKQPELIVFGKYLRRIRETKGFTQESFAHAVGINPRYYGAIERGEMLKKGIISFETPVPAKSSLRTQRLQLIKRLQHLEALGLAKKTASKCWRLNEHLESTLKHLQLANDVLKSHAQTQSGFS